MANALTAGNIEVWSRELQRQRDKKMIEDFHRHQSMKRLSYPPSNSLREWCERQTSTQPECDPKQ